MKKLFAMFFLTMTVLFLGMGGYADANVSPSESSIAKSVKSSPIIPNTANKSPAWLSSCSI